jgi:hypothetical protein
MKMGARAGSGIMIGRTTFKSSGLPPRRGPFSVRIKTTEYSCGAYPGIHGLERPQRRMKPVGGT